MLVDYLFTHLPERLAVGLGALQLLSESAHGSPPASGGHA